MNSTKKTSEKQQDFVMPRLYTDYSVWTEEFLKIAKTKLWENHYPLYLSLADLLSETKPLSAIEALRKYTHSHSFEWIHSSDIIRMGNEAITLIEKCIQETVSKLESRDFHTYQDRAIHRQYTFQGGKEDTKFALAKKKFDDLAMEWARKEFFDSPESEDNAMWQLRHKVRKFRKELKSFYRGLLRETNVEVPPAGAFHILWKTMQKTWKALNTPLTLSKN